ncbi:hypothetical protein TIFTF001_050274 [Ficus carica]|uniref:Uncharacterized protein n=1 Tax=Ficus carica TaxID=3494 RepID=A0AA88CJA8_FICCA|nr:hypothetical protein TIFTF001_050274 [Ficus carica]
MVWQSEEDEACGN